VNDTKSWLASRTVWVGIVSLLFAVASALNFLPEGLTQEMVVEAIMALVGVGVIVFRVRATHEIAPPK
jgi:hypothetical protein